MAREFIQHGYQKVYVLKGGWHEWIQARFPTEPTEDVNCLATTLERTMF